MVFVGFLTMLNELGLGAAVVQCRNLDDNTLRPLFGLILIASVIFYLLLAVAAPFIAGFYNEPRLTILLQILALQFLLSGLSILPRSLLQRNMKFRKLAIIDSISGIAGSFTTIALALTGYGVWALVWGNLMIQLVAMVGFNTVQPFLFLPIIRMKGMWSLFSFGSYVTLSRLIWYFYSRADVLIIGKILGKELLGFYNIGLLLARLPMEKVSGIINQVAFPAYSSVQSDPGMAGQHFLKAVRVMSFIAFPVLWGISSISTEIVTIFLDQKWISAALPMQIIALVIPIRMISNLMNPAVLGAGRSDLSFYNALVPLIFMIPAFFIGSFWGIIGVSLAWVIVFPIAFYLNLGRVVKILKLRIIDVFKAMQLPCLSSLIMYVCIMNIKFVLNLDIKILKMIILIGCGFSIYCLITFVINRKGLKEIRDLLRF